MNIMALIKRVNLSFVFTLFFLSYSDDSDSVSQRPRSRSVQASPQLSPMRSLDPDYDLDRQASPRENHNNKNHSRWENSCHEVLREDSDLLYNVPES